MLRQLLKKMRKKFPLVYKDPARVPQVSGFVEENMIYLFDRD